MATETASDASPAAAGVQAQRRTRVRFGILALLAIGTAINYLDRSVLGIAAPGLSKELGLSAVAMGFVFSAFSWTYTLAQIPGGIFLDRFGAKLTYFLSVTFWSCFILLHGFASNLATLLGYRFGLGVAEAPCFPANSRIVAHWFPQQERARATSIYTVGEYVGLAFLSPLLFAVMGSYGWRSLFILVGVIGLLFGLLWWRCYREPHHSRSVNQAELEYIREGGGLDSGHSEKGEPFSWSNFRKLLRYRQIWGAGIGQFAGNVTLVFFLTWFPTYLVTERHMGWLKIGFFAVMPFLAAAVGVLAGGWLSDKLLIRSGSANLARKLPITGGLLLASTIVSANWVQSDLAVIAIMSVAFFGQGMVGLGWTVISDVAPKHLIGLSGGLFNLCTNCAGIITPLVIGYIVAATGSFVWALVFVGAMALVGVFSYIFVLGDVRRIDIDA